VNICFPSLSYPFNGEATSGVGSQVRLLAHALVESGHTVSVVDLAAAESTVASDDHGVDVYREPCGKFHWFFGKIPFIGKVCALALREIEYSIAVWRGVRKAQRRRRIDLIEGTETGMLLLALLWKKSPVIIRLHGEQYTFHKYTPGMRLSASVRLSRWIQRVALRRAKLLISPSYAHAREIRDELRGPLPPIVVVPNALGIEKGNGHRQTTKAPNVLYAGRIEQRKGIETLLNAAAQTREELPQSQFIFAGDFHSSVSPIEFQRLVRKHQLDEHVSLLGPVSWNVLRQLYKDATVAVLPSHYETFGLAALEPMAFGTPVVASASSALPEVVVDEENGKLVAPGDCGALARAMIEILSEPAARDRMGKAAVEHAALFDIRKLMPLNERVYQWCLCDSFSADDTHVFFSPHLDDAVLSCGGAIDSLVAEKKDVRVITIFAGEDDNPKSAFVRHLQRKWGGRADVAQLRRQEDERALQSLGVTNIEQWNYAEAVYRSKPDGEARCGTYEDLRTFESDDQQLAKTLTERILAMNFVSPKAVLYFPLALGQHIDHRILFDVGCELVAQGQPVRFYEDFPYAEKYDAEPYELNWMPRTVSIKVSKKAEAAFAYTTQLPGLGGSRSNLEKRLRAVGARVKSNGMTERYWERLPQSPGVNSQLESPIVPLRIHQVAPRFADFKNFLDTFRWHDLNEIMPVGEGNCLDLGCGNARHRSFIESQGYVWIGLDVNQGAADIAGDAASIPLAACSLSALVAWQVLEYAEQPQSVFAEAARVLGTGGIFCGSASFLEPVHGRTYYNISPLMLEKILNQNGFGDIEIKPGLNGLSLMLWTWLSRVGIPGAAQLAIPAAALAVVPLAGLLFFLSWLSRLMGFGTGHLMRWLTQVAPLEFAGHVMFCARKKPA
jgi:glycosyltransferase involved in cell wall biosynthesis/LmbE family N-acetylglucosaminyl deacetylase/SAM-dependent methyltransferase